MPSDQTFDAVAITLNPAIDRMVTIRGFAAGAVNRAEEARDIAGGKGVNAASLLADYGLMVAATGFLGRENATPFEALFARKGIADRFLRVDGLTRVGIKVFDPERNETTDINFPGLTPSPAELAGLRTRLASVPGAWAILAGSLPPGVGASYVRELAADLKGRGVRVALDTSGGALAAGIEAGPALIKPNLEELRALVGLPLRDLGEIAAAARGLVARGIDIVAVSMGPAGSVFATAGGAVLARSTAVRVASTVGAGDAMTAGIVAGQIRGLALGACAGLATAFSLHSLAHRADGRPGTPEAIDGLVAAVEVVPL